MSFTPPDINYVYAKIHTSAIQMTKQSQDCFPLGTRADGDIKLATKSIAQFQNLIETELGFKDLPPLKPLTTLNIFVKLGFYPHYGRKIISISIPHNQTSIIGSRYGTQTLSLGGDDVIMIFPFPLYHKFVVIYLWKSNVCEVYLRPWNWYVNLTLKTEYGNYGNFLITTGTMCNQIGFTDNFCNKFEAALLTASFIDNTKQLNQFAWYRITHQDLRIICEQVICRAADSNKRVILNKSLPPDYIRFPAYILKDFVGLRRTDILESKLADRMFKCIQQFKHRTAAFNFIQQNIELVIRIMETSTSNFLYKDYIELICCFDRLFPLELVDLIAKYICLM